MKVEELKKLSNEYIKYLKHRKTVQMQIESLDRDLSDIDDELANLLLEMSTGMGKGNELDRYIQLNKNQVMHIFINAFGNPDVDIINLLRDNKIGDTNE